MAEPLSPRRSGLPQWSRDTIMVAATVGSIVVGAMKITAGQAAIVAANAEQTKAIVRVNEEQTIAIKEQGVAIAAQTRALSEMTAVLARIDERVNDNRRDIDGLLNRRKTP